MITLAQCGRGSYSPVATRVFSVYMSSNGDYGSVYSSDGDLKTAFLGDVQGMVAQSDPESGIRRRKEGKTGLPRWNPGRVRRKKKAARPVDRLEHIYSSEVQRVVAHCLVSGFDEEQCNKLAITMQGTMITDNVVHFVAGHNMGDVFVFTEYGSVVLWGLDAWEEEAVIRKLETYEIPNEFGPTLTDDDDYEFAYTGIQDGQFTIVGDVLVLPDMQVHSENDIQYKLSCSFALATSVKLGTLEDEIDKVIRETENVPRELALQGKVVSLSKHAVSCKIGELFMHKASINLMYDILDTPEHFWDKPLFQSVYDDVRKHTEISLRVDVLNKRMEVLSELLSILQQEKSEQHSNKLEWIVIWLIIIEVFLGLFEIYVTLRSGQGGVI